MRELIFLDANILGVLLIREMNTRSKSWREPNTSEARSRQQRAKSRKGGERERRKESLSERQETNK
jgi:hypothetical protein